MDNRVILNLPGSIEIGRIPELRDMKNVVPVLTSSSPVRFSAQVSLIVPTFFNSILKQRSLEHLLAGLSNSKTIAEVILVASDGEDETFPELGREGALKNLTVVSAPPHNRAASRNLGAAAAQREFLLFLDDDMVPKDWRIVDVLLSNLIEFGHDCALFPRRQYVRFPLLFDRWAVQQTIGSWRSGKTSSDPFFFDPIRDGTKDLPMLFCFPGCFTLIRKQAFEQLNGFDQKYVGWGYEDTDFAVRAMETLNVLNLFRKSEPFLHIDHPVSPYKSEEYHANTVKFFSDSRSVDIHRFSRRIFSGRDFGESDRKPLGPEIHLEAFQKVASSGVPLVLEELAPWALTLAQKLTSRFSYPHPEFGILHGSRAQRRAKPESDFDVLFLYDCPIQEFYTSSGSPRVEIECGGLLLFDQIATNPCYFDHRGVLELAKLANSKLFWGDVRRWSRWRRALLMKAVKNGRAFWLALAVGLRINSKKYGALTDRYFTSLVQILESARVPDDLEELISSSLPNLATHTALVLDEAQPSWREDARHRTKVFSLQVPEVWIGLDYILERSGAGDLETASYARVR
jgi:glycosyltransferase involved in cell wall biosynthesis